MIISLCVDCVVMDANGWEENLIGRPIPTPTPLGLLSPEVKLGEVDQHEHFSNSPCQGCGSDLAGARFDYTLERQT